MLLLTFHDNTIETGVPFSVMAQALKDLARVHPKAKMDTAMRHGVLYWPRSAGIGALIVEAPGEDPREIAMPVRKPGQQEAGAVVFPMPCRLRVCPQGGEVLTIPVTASGNYAVARSKGLPRGLAEESSPPATRRTSPGA